ncbi:MAG: hypothetical protein PF795_06395, partial [Kiritimatiellae bacterium]|nr:hypothetical protein [Kiritimatiellia bacterium]
SLDPLILLFEFTGLPVVRVPVKMHYRHDRNELGVDTEKNAEWERLCKASANVVLDNRIHFGIELDPV